MIKQQYGKGDQIAFEYEHKLTSLDKHLRQLKKELYIAVNSLDYLFTMFDEDKEYKVCSEQRYTSDMGKNINTINTLVEEVFEIEPTFLLTTFCKEYELNFKCYKGIRYMNQLQNKTNIMGSSRSVVNLLNEKEANEPLMINNNAKLVSEVTGNFITLMDALNLNYTSKQKLHPLMSRLVLNLNKVFIDKNETFDAEKVIGRMGTFEESRGKLVEWLVFMNKDEVGVNLEKDDLDKMMVDLEEAYKKFYDLLG